MFGRATITLGIGPHSSYKYYFDLCWTKLGDKMRTHIDNNSVHYRLWFNFSSTKMNSACFKEVVIT